jgi:hypothetical protein
VAVPSGEVMAVTWVPGSSQAPSKQGSMAAVAHVTIRQPSTAPRGWSTATIRRPVRSLQVAANFSRLPGVGL